MALSAKMLNMTDTGSNRRVVLPATSGKRVYTIEDYGLGSSFNALNHAVEESGMQLPVGLGFGLGSYDSSEVNRALRDFVSNPVDTFNNNVVPIIEPVAEKVENVVKTVGKTAKDILNGDTNAINSVINAISSLGSSFSSSFGSGFSSLGSAIRDSAKMSAQSDSDMMKLINETTAANNAWSAEQAQINRDWQERMSNTAHQREMADLKAAGLNPVLAVSGGSGATTGSGAVAQADTSNTRLLAEVAMQAVEAAQETAKGVSRIASGMSTDSILGKLLNSNAGKRFVGNAAGTLGTMLVKSMF